MKPKKGMKEFYNDIARQFAEEWYQNESMLPVLKEFLSLLPPSPRVLDLGCGAGYESMRLKKLGASVVGIDFSEEPIRIARERNPDSRFEIMDFREMDHSLGIFDGAAAIASFIHISENELEPVFRGISRVLKKDGYLLVAVIDGTGLSEQKSCIERDGVAYDRPFYLYTKEGLDAAAEKCGFRYYKEMELGEEHRAYGWKCHVFKVEELSLIEPAADWEAAYNEMLEDWELNDTHPIPWYLNFDNRDFAGMVKTLEGLSRGEGVGCGFVESSTFWLVNGKREVLGAINIRHRLNAFYLTYGGQIGYCVKPSQRRKGYAREMLRLGLEICREMGFEKVLLCCNAENEGSVRTIMANRGILASEEVIEGERVQRYWITP